MSVRQVVRILITGVLLFVVVAPEIAQAQPSKTARRAEAILQGQKAFRPQAHITTWDNVTRPRNSRAGARGEAAQRGPAIHSTPTISRGVVTQVNSGTATISSTSRGSITTSGASLNKRLPSASSHLGGQRRNHLQPDRNAVGPHSTYKRDQRDRISGYTEWTPNTRNPSGFDEVKRVDLRGRSHYNKVTRQDVPTPHVVEKSTPGRVRPAEPGEIPNRSNR